MKTLKTALFNVTIFFGANNLSAQLENTVWKGIFLVPDAHELVMNFKKDTVTLQFAFKYNLGDLSDKNLLEKMTYKVDKDKLTLQKVSGGSPCDNRTVGIYRFAVKDEKLLITLVSDDCIQRSSAFPAEALTSYN